MQINYGNDKPIDVGSVHIKLPFKSMDDVSFSGNFAPVADKLVETLMSHLDAHKDDPENNPWVPQDMEIKPKEMQPSPEEDQQDSGDESRTMNPEEAQDEELRRRLLQQTPLQAPQGL